MAKVSVPWCDMKCDNCNHKTTCDYYNNMYTVEIDADTYVNDFDDIDPEGEEYTNPEDKGEFNNLILE